MKMTQPILEGVTVLYLNIVKVKVRNIYTVLAGCLGRCDIPLTQETKPRLVTHMYQFHFGTIAIMLTLVSLDQCASY